MNKKIKYILGYAIIFILAVLCTYGIINYEQLKNKIVVNNSQNLGSVEGKQISKETTIIIEKLSTLNDLDSLNSELKLSDATLKELKKYAPTVSYAVEKEGNEDRIILKQGGYHNQFKLEKENEIIGAYKVKDGKLESTGEKTEELNSKYKKDNISWKTLDVKNTEHNNEVATKFANVITNILDGTTKDTDASLVITEFSDAQKHIKVDEMLLFHIPMPLSEIIDAYNALQPDTVNEEYVMNKLKSSQYLKYREIDDTLTGNEEKYSKVLKEGELIFFKKDKMVLATYRGHGAIFLKGPSKPDMWKIEGDKITIPYSTSVIGNTYKGKLVLRLNNKKYEGGQSRSKYYVESVSN